MSKKLFHTFEFVNTEEQAKELCASIQANQNNYRKIHHKPYYHPWTSQDGKEHKFLVWYVI